MIRKKENSLIKQLPRSGFAGTVIGAGLSLSAILGNCSEAVVPSKGNVPSLDDVRGSQPTTRPYAGVASSEVLELPVVNGALGIARKESISFFSCKDVNMNGKMDNIVDIYSSGPSVYKGEIIGLVGRRPERGQGRIFYMRAAQQIDKQDPMWVEDLTPKEREDSSDMEVRQIRVDELAALHRKAYGVDPAKVTTFKVYVGRRNGFNRGTGKAMYAMERRPVFIHVNFDVERRMK